MSEGDVAQNYASFSEKSRFLSWTIFLWLHPVDKQALT